MWLRITLTVSCLVLCNAEIVAQPVPTYRAVFSSDGPFFTSCEEQTPVPEDAHVVILWDSDHNGPGGYDQIPYTDLGFPEGMFGNIYDFYTDEGGDFTSPVFEGYYMYHQPEPFYLILEHVDSVVTHWTSPVATLQPVQSNWDPPQSVFLPAAQWTCDTATQAIQCETDPPYVIIPMHLGIPDPFCIRTCPGGWTDIYLWHMDDSLDATTVPVINIERGCNDSLPAEFDFDPLKWTFLFDTWECYIFGHELGWYTVTFLEEAPAGVIDNFEAERISQTVSLNWTTSRETDIDHFELWSYHTDYRYWLRHLGNFAGVGEPSEYSFLDDNPQPPTGYIWYCLLMVTSDSVRWSARRAFVPRPLESGDLSPLVETPQLYHNYPNPFNATTQIEFELPVTTNIELQVYDINGRLVTTLAYDHFAAGSHTITFDGSSFSSGIYFARLTAGEFQMTQKMVLLK